VGQLGSVRPGARDWTVAVVYGLGNWVLDVACLAASAAALGVRGVSLPLLLIAYPAGMAASSISLLPGGIGVVDTTMVLAMVAGGIPAAAALPAVLLFRLISLVAVVAAGWLIVAVQARGGRVRSVRSRAQARSAGPAGVGGAGSARHRRGTREPPVRVERMPPAAPLRPEVLAGQDQSDRVVTVLDIGPEDEAVDPVAPGPPSRTMLSPGQFLRPHTQVPPRDSADSSCAREFRS
jgi:hypothetical protein